MLHPPPSSEQMPLFSNDFASSSSLPYILQNRPVFIQRPSCASLSFEWSDFPIEQQQDAIVRFPSYSSIEDTEQKRRRHRHQKTPLSTTNLPSLASGSDMSLASSSSDFGNASTKHKRVSFSNTLGIRTHSVVVGDHPCCPILALDLGWEYNDDTVGVKDYKMMSGRHQPKRVRPRSYMERKHLLQRVSSAIDAIEMDLPILTHSGPSCHDKLCDMEEDITLLMK